MFIDQLPRILVVEDDDLTREMIRRRLERHGFSVTTASGGQLAVSLLEANRFDVLLLDWMMPGTSGMDVVRWVRARFSPTALPIIMVTAKTQREDIVQALDEGANDYITKPIDFPVAVARIRTQVALRRSEECLRISEERYALAAKGANDGLWDWDLQTNAIYLSARWKELVGYDATRLGTDPDEWLSRIHSEDLEMVRKQIDDHLSGSTEKFEIEFRMQHSDGSWRWMLARGVAVRDGTGIAYRFAGSLSDVTVRHNTEERLRYDALRDPLTHLYNRRYFDDRLEGEMTLSRRRNTALSLCVFDIDCFKGINDRYGHHVGDEVIRRIGTILNTNLRREDIPVRLGGDEFCVLFPHTGVTDARIVVERIRRKFLMEVVKSEQGGPVAFSATFGVAEYDSSYMTATDFIEKADAALYDAKRCGRNRVHISTPSKTVELRAVG